MDITNYTITHVADGKFSVELADGSVKEAGPNLCGMVRYTYFEDYTIPPVGWQVTNKQLLEDYAPKAHRDILSGKLKPNVMNC